MLDLFEACYGDQIHRLYEDLCSDNLADSHNPRTWTIRRSDPAALPLTDAVSFNPGGIVPGARGGAQLTLAFRVAPGATPIKTIVGHPAWFILA